MLPAMTSIVTFIRTDVLPALGAFKEEALEPLWNFIQNDIVPAFDKVVEVGGHVADAFQAGRPHGGVVGPQRLYGWQAAPRHRRDLRCV